MTDIFEYFYDNGKKYYLEWQYMDPAGKEHLIKLSRVMEQYPNMEAAANNSHWYMKSIATRIAREQYREWLLSRNDLDTISKSILRDGTLDEWD